MPKNFYFLAAFFSFLLLNTGYAQAQQKKPATTGTASGKKPNVKTYLGKVTGTTTLTATEGSQLVSQPIQIIDDKNVTYNISSYQFAYKRLGVSEDEETGKAVPQSDMAADRFTVTPLPAIWQKNIVEGLHKGEELYFFDIIAFDKQGRRFFAPEIKITIQ